MTVLSAAQSASVVLVGRRIASLYSPSNAADGNIAIELAELANEVAADIMNKHDWQALTKFETYTGDGTSEAFPLPADYNRMLIDSNVYDPQIWAWGYHHIRNVNDWMVRRRHAWITPGGWLILNNMMNFYPAPGPSNSAEFAYISKNYARNMDGNEKATFSSDTDEFFLGDRLLKLGLIWRYRAQKRLEYAEDMENYEVALSEAMARDGGSRSIRSRSFPRGNYRWAWPFELGNP